MEDKNKTTTQQTDLCENIIIPHGFQDHYTIGYVNGIAKNRIKHILVSSDRLNNIKFDPNVTNINLIGSGDPSRKFVRKTIEYLYYHARLLSLVSRSCFRANIHIIGLLKYPFLLGIVENLLLRLLSKRLILTVHNLLPHDKQNFVNKFLYYWIYRIPHYLIVHTDKMKDELVNKFNVAENHILLMEHGINDVIDPPVFEKKTIYRKEINIPENKRMLLFFGSVSHYKGVDTLIEAFSLLDERYFLVIAGRAQDSQYATKIKNKIATIKNHNRIQYLDRYINDNEVTTLFGAADALIMPYRHIDQSGIIFLAIRMGVPIIAFNVGKLDSYITDEIGIIADQNDSGGLLSSIKLFDRNINHYDSDIISTHSKNYEWRSVVKPILFIYSE